MSQAPSPSSENPASLDVFGGGNISIAFGTPLLSEQWANSDDLNRTLREIILRKESNDTGVALTNVRGWQSKDDLIVWGGDAIAELQHRIAMTTRAITASVCGDSLRGLKADMAIAAWANVSRDRAYNIVHSHPGCAWSGVYYVDLGVPDPAATAESGAIEFIDPRVGVNWAQLPGAPFGASKQIRPVPGLMLMFPSWLQHWVHPFHGRGERITIAFNVDLKFRPVA